MASKCDEEKNSFTNQVVKDKIVFPLFFVTSNGFQKFALDFRFFFFLAKKPGYKKVDQSSEKKKSRASCEAFQHLPYDRPCERIKPCAIFLDTKFLYDF